MQETHIIRRIRLRVNSRGQGDPFQLRQRSEALCTRQIPDQIEKVLGRFQVDDLIEIPAIQVNVELENWDMLEEAILKRTGEAIEKASQKSIAVSFPSPGENDEHGVSGDAERKSGSIVHTAHNTFTHFLASGSLPWWASYSGMAELETDIIASWNKLSDVQQRHALLEGFKKLTDLQTALQRLVSQFSPSFVEHVLRVLNADTAKSISLLQQLIDKIKNEHRSKNELLNRIRNQFTVSILEILIRNGRDSSGEFIHVAGDSNSVEQFIKERLQSNEETPNLQKAVADFLKSYTAGAPPAASSQHDHLKREPQVETDYFMVGNAGLILLHPFLEKFFSHLQLLDDNGDFRSGTASQAIQLLQYLSSGKDDEPEFKMILNKILCGVPVQFPTGKIEITPDEKEACEELLRAVINHWSALKNTSPAALQNMFLHREGKLEFKDEVWHLKVEQRTEDILLERLPWSISRIKTPWMKNWLLTEWNT